MNPDDLQSVSPISRHLPEAARKIKEPKPIPTVSAILEDGSIVETLYRPKEYRTVFCIFREGSWREEQSLVSAGQRLVPYSPGNNLLCNGVVLLPSEPQEFGTEADLLAELEAYIHAYVDLSPLFEKLAAYYVVLSWLYDSFNELPYLRARGDYGSGKTRFLLTVGSICYKPIFASGASTVSPLFRILEAFRGTLILDEGDFRSSDEKTELVKILNNGNARGFPVLRSEQLRNGEFDPRAYHVFGPKIVASRGFFEDRALESRFLTEEMGQSPLRPEIPINLPPEQAVEALVLRNKLLLFRFRTYAKPRPMEPFRESGLEPRLNQIFAPLFAIVDDAGVRDDLRRLAHAYQEEIVTDRGMETEAQILQILRDMIEAGQERLALQDIAGWFADRHADEYERKINPRWVGWHLRRRLGLRTQKSHGQFIVPLGEMPKLQRLWGKYGITDEERSSPQKSEDPFGPQTGAG